MTFTEKNRLKIVIDNSGLSQKYFAEKYHITYEALKNYLYGRRKIPVDFLIEVAKDYKYSLDWFYGVDEEFSKRDSMVQIVNALSKVFTVAIRKTPFCENDQVLLMDRRFKSLLSDIQSLCFYEKNLIKLDQKIYDEQRRLLYEKYEPYIHELLGEVTFDENDAFEIYGIQSMSYNNLSDSVLNYLISGE